MTTQADAAAERHRQIVERIESIGRVDVGDLAARMDVAYETIRRDLRQLELQGLLQRVHGGAVRRPEQPLSPFDGTTPSHRAEHIRLADLVVNRLPTAGTVIMGASPITWAVAETLSRRPPTDPGLAVVTASLDVAVILSRVPSIHVYNVGGSVDGASRAQQGDWALTELGRFRADLAIVAPCGVTDDGVFATDPISAATLAAEIGSARQVWALVDGPVARYAGPVRASSLAPISTIFVAGQVNADDVAPLIEAGAEVVVS